MVLEEALPPPADVALARPGSPAKGDAHSYPAFLLPCTARLLATMGRGGCTEADRADAKGVGLHAAPEQGQGHAPDQGSAFRATDARPEAQGWTGKVAQQKPVGRVELVGGDRSGATTGDGSDASWAVFYGQPQAERGLDELA